jgi:ribosome-binding protein aMBF1 (putative translation factor)
MLKLSSGEFRSDALHELYEEVIGDNPERRAMLDQEILNVEVAQAIYDMRTTAGLTQRQLAKRAGTTAPVICQLENADHVGVTLAMLRRIANVVDRGIEIHAVPLTAA